MIERFALEKTVTFELDPVSVAVPYPKGELDMEATFEPQAIRILGTVALALMVVVTGGVVYLTAVDWRDRRRRKRDQQSTKLGKVKKK